MSHTRPANRARSKKHPKWWLGPLILALANFASATIGQEAQELPVLDLTKKRPVKGKPLPVPGASLEGIFRGGKTIIIPQPYRLPLETQIRTARPADADPRGTWIVELELRNTGDTPFYLPHSRDPWTVHAEGNKGKRAFHFSVRFFVPGKWETEASVVASTSGAATLPDSLLRLNPQQSVLVLLPVRLTSIRHRLSREAHDLSLQVICKEWTFEDDRYYIKTRSHDLESENFFRISLQPGTPPPHK